MPTSSGFFTASIGKKYLVAFTAVVWSVFVMIHMLGNLFIFAGARAYNTYSHALTSNPLVIVIEFVLLACLLTHAALALSLTLKNRQAKPQGYAVAPVKAKSAPVSARTMAYTGSIVFAFIVWHLITFKWGPQYFVAYDGVRMRDIYSLVVEKFHQPSYVVSYCFVVLLVGVHLYHGIASVFQTFGLNHPRYRCFFRCFGYTYAVVVALGFFSQPVYVFLAR